MGDIGQDRIGRIYHVWADTRGRVRLYVEDGFPEDRVFEADRSAGEIKVMTDDVAKMLIADFNAVDWAGSRKIT